jgi:hypothetical protein
MGDADNLGYTEVPRGAYGADLAVLDRSQRFSGELLRLALGAVGAIAYLLRDPASCAAAPPTVGRLMAAGIVLFGLGAAAALGHRYYSSDGLFHHLKALRLRSRATPASAHVAHQECALRNWDLALAAWLLFAAVALVAVGASVTCAGLAVACL